MKAYMGKFLRYLILAYATLFLQNVFADEDVKNIIQRNAVYRENFLNPYAGFSVLLPKNTYTSVTASYVFNENSGAFSKVETMLTDFVGCDPTRVDYKRNGAAVIEWCIVTRLVYTILSPNGVMERQKYGDEYNADSAAKNLYATNDLTSVTKEDSSSQPGFWKRIRIFFSDIIEKLKSILGWSHKSAAPIESNALKVGFERELCGYQNNNAWKIAPQFTTCEPFEQNIAVIEYYGIKGIINRDGKWLTQKPDVNIISTSLAGLPKVGGGFGGVGVIDRKGKWILPPLLSTDEQYVLDSDALISCNNNNNNSILSSCKRISITTPKPPVEITAEGVAKKFETPDQFQAVEWPAPKAENDLWGFVDNQGAWVISPRFAKASFFSEGVAAVSSDGKVWGYIDSTSAFVIKEKYGAANDFHHGVAWVESDGWLLIDKSEKRLTENLFTAVNDFESDFTTAQHGEIHYFVKATGEFHEFDGEVRSANPSSELVPAFKSEFSWGYIDHNGNWVLPPTFASASDFVGEYAVARSANPSNIVEALTDFVKVEKIEFSKNKMAAYITFNINGISKGALLNTQTTEFMHP